MPTASKPKPAVLENVAPHLRDQIVSGMRWTLWVSVLTAPLSYGTTVLLARVSPAAIGNYGLLLLYVALSSTIFYFGGDAVVINFVPSMEREKRLAFFLSYFGVILLTLVPWFAVALLWPGKLHYVFGHDITQRGQVLLLCLAPLYIMFSLVQAALKAVMEIREAQLLFRIVAVGSFSAYAALFFFAKPFLAKHYIALIWGIYIALIAVAIVLGLIRLLRGQYAPHAPKFFLPQGFWRYTIAFESMSAVNFFGTRLDFLLVLNFGGLALLGKYVVVNTVAEALKTANKFFVDSLLPSLTNLLAHGNREGIAELYSVNLRTILLVNTTLTTAIILLVGPITSIFGPNYKTIQDLFVILMVCVGTANCIGISGPLLSAFGKQNWFTAATILQIACFVGIFVALWPRYQLKGAVIAAGVAMLIGRFLQIVAARVVTHIKFAFLKDFLLVLAVNVLAGAVSMRFLPLSFLAGVATWVLVMAAFFVAAGYSIGEVKHILHHFLPGRISRRFL